jgi:hypothetical protein
MFFSHPHSIFHGVKKSMKSPFSTKNSWPFHGGDLTTSIGQLRPSCTSPQVSSALRSH